VTGAVRILSNVFDDRSRRPDLNVRPGDLPASMSSEIGGVFLLKRLVLVSPDIPAETLISGRANFLSTSLLRFEEASLFSNEGDEVLRQISTTANYFSFPTTHNKFGYRLGNVCLRDIKYGITRDINLKKLQIGRESLHSIYSEMEKMGSDPLRDDLPKHFSYFDCTSCIENKQGGVEKGSGVLTLAKLGPAKKMGPFNHFCLLFLYIIWPRIYDVHGGYFRSQFLGKLIYRLACIGYEETKTAFEKEATLDFGGKDTFDAELKRRQIKVLKS
jgi:hypothetical protein